MSARELAAALDTIGISCRVEEQGKLAVIIATERLTLDAKTRRAIVARGRANGFTNVCIELNTVDATVPGA